MALVLEGRAKATGIVAFIVAGTPAWAGDHPGFIAAIQDNAPGDFTVSLDGAESGGGLGVSATVQGGIPGSVTVFGQVGRAIRIQTFDDAGILVDNLPVALLATQIPPQS